MCLLCNDCRRWIIRQEAPPTLDAAAGVLDAADERLENALRDAALAPADVEVGLVRQRCVADRVIREQSNLQDLESRCAACKIDKMRSARRCPCISARGIGLVRQGCTAERPLDDSRASCGMRSLQNHAFSAALPLHQHMSQSP